MKKSRAYINRRVLREMFANCDDPFVYDPASPYIQKTLRIRSLREFKNQYLPYLFPEYRTYSRKLKKLRCGTKHMVSQLFLIAMQLDITGNIHYEKDDTYYWDVLRKQEI